MALTSIVVSALLTAGQAPVELPWVAVTGPKLTEAVQKPIRIAADRNALKLPKGWKVAGDSSLVLAMDENALGITEIRRKITLLKWLKSSGLKHGGTLDMAAMPKDMQEVLLEQAESMGGWTSEFVRGRGSSLKIQAISRPTLNLSQGGRQASLTQWDSGPESATTIVSGANPMLTEQEEERCAAAARKQGEPEPVAFHFSSAFAGAERSAEGLRKASLLVDQVVKELKDEKDKLSRALAEELTNLKGDAAADSSRVGKPLDSREISPGMNSALFDENPGLFRSPSEAASFLRSAQVSEVRRQPMLRIVIATTPTIGPNVPYRVLSFSL